MKTSRTNLLRDIEALKSKLAFLEDVLSRVDEVKHFPSKGDKYYYTYMGVVCSNEASNDDLKVNVFKTRDDAVMAYNKAVALEKVKRRLLELQGDWIPNWKDGNELKTNICYYHYSKVFEVEAVYFSQSFSVIPYMKNEGIAQTIINEFHSELRLILNIA